MFYPHYCKSHEKSLVVFEHHDHLGTALATDSCVFCQKKRCRQNSRVVWGISQYFICHNMSQLRAHEFHKHRRNRKNRGTNTWQQFKGKTLYTSTGLVPSGASAPPPVHLFSAAPVSDSPALYLTWPAMLKEYALGILKDLQGKDAFCIANEGIMISWKWQTS